MNWFSRHRLQGVVLVAASSLLLGCGSEKVVPVRGKIVDKGQPYRAQLNVNPDLIPPGEEELAGLVTVTFYPVQDENQPIANEEGEVEVGGYSAVVHEDGSFTVPGPKGKGLPPGKYRITLQHLDPRTQQDVLKHRFSPASSRITREVTNPEAELVFDVGKPTG